MARRKNSRSLPTKQERVTPYDREQLLNRIATRIRQSLELQEILTTTAVEIRGFLDTDRVKIYRFYADGSGEVIAESIKGDRLPSLLGLHFPASDVPTHSREMFVKVRQRVIVDVASGQKTLNWLDKIPGEDLRHLDESRYQPVEPCHLEYLTNLGVTSSLAVPILYQNNLWGLLVSHHIEARHFSERELTVVQMLVDQVSIAIAQSSLLAQARQQARHEAMLHQISSLLHSPLNILEIRQTVLEETVKALQCSGGRLYLTAEPTGQQAEVYLFGKQPTLPWIEESPFWQRIMGSLNYTPAEIEEDAQGFSCQVLPNPLEKFAMPEVSLFLTKNKDSPLGSKDLNGNLYIISDIYQEPQLKPLLAAFQEPIRSMMIVPLQYRQQCVGCLTLFRDELETETLWAGRNDRDVRNLRPRSSFAVWREIKKGQAQEWDAEEIRLVQALGIHLYMAVMQRQVEDTIRHQASHDLLTGLPNRLLFNDRLSLALANTQQQGEMLAVVFLDLDGFKTINDTLGHAMGDRLLQSVAKRLSSCLREGDLVARWGGDEFTLLLAPITCAKDASQVAQQILGNLNIPFILDAQELYVKASIGIALAPYDGEDAETLLKNADAAMYRAKQQGRNSYQMYTPAIGNKILKRLVLENNLYKALEREEFLLHYQPQIEISTGKIVGMEALIRWQSTEMGLIAPDQFIPLAEETGLICPIGEWVLRTACDRNRAWQRLGLPPIHIAVNLSARQIQDKNLVRSVAEILLEIGLEPSYLDLEITESVAMQDIDLTISVLKALQNMGIQISMDDFGTGYSSLNALKHFPLTYLKIDKSFIRDLMNDSHDAAIIKAIVALGQGLNLKVIAEGVETKEQLDFLRSVGCDRLQGYLFSRPLPAEAATKLYIQQLGDEFKSGSAV